MLRSRKFAVFIFLGLIPQSLVEMIRDGLVQVLPTMLQTSRVSGYHQALQKGVVTPADVKPKNPPVSRSSF